VGTKSSKPRGSGSCVGDTYFLTVCPSPTHNPILSSPHGRHSTEGDDATALPRHPECLATFQRLLSSHLILVELGEVINDDRNRQRDHQHSAHTAGPSHHLTPRRLGIHIPVADGCHGDSGPPERCGDATEQLLVVLLLGEVGEAGEDEDANGEEHHEQAELLVAPVEGVAEGLEPSGMTSQLQDPQDAHDPEDLNDPPDVLELFRTLVGLDQHEGDVVGKDGEQVYDIHGSLHEYQLAWADQETKNVLQCKPSDATYIIIPQVLLFVLFAASQFTHYKHI